jgi:hypothetical protein
MIDDKAITLFAPINDYFGSKLLSTSARYVHFVKDYTCLNNEIALFSAYYPVSYLIYNLTDSLSKITVCYNYYPNVEIESIKFSVSSLFAFPFSNIWKSYLSTFIASTCISYSLPNSTDYLACNS